MIAAHAAGRADVFPARAGMNRMLEVLERVCSAREAGNGFCVHGLRPGGGEVSPVWPGQPVTAHWGIPDPAGVVDDDRGVQMLASREGLRLLEQRIKLFLALPVASLDRMA